MVLENTSPNAKIDYADQAAETAICEESRNHQN